MILHIATINTFTRPFFYFVKEHFDLEGHVVLSRSRTNAWPEDLQLISYHGMWLGWVVSFVYLAVKAEKILLHNLNDPRVVLLLFFQPWVLKKCYWIIWGGDLYAHEEINRNLKWGFKEIFRRSVVKRIGHLVTSVEGDVELARKWYGASGQYHDCVVYTSNLCPDISSMSRKDYTTNIQIGNSADPSNNHLALFEKIWPFRDENIKIHVPLSYGGDPAYKDAVIKAGNRIFGNKFEALIDFMPVAEYLSYLAQIDIAVFDHNRQQGMGNIIALLGFGKKVYVRNCVTSYSFFCKIGIKIFDLSEFNLELLSPDVSKQNSVIIQSVFSKARLACQLDKLFGRVGST